MACILWPHAVDEDKDDLVDQQAKQETQCCRQGDVSSVASVFVDPPLQSHPQHHARNAEIRDAGHERVKHGIAACQIVDASGYQDIDVLLENAWSLPGEEWREVDRTSTVAVRSDGLGRVYRTDVFKILVR